MFAGDVEVDEVLTNNDVGDTITIISHLAETGGKEKRGELHLTAGVNVSKLI